MIIILKYIFKGASVGLERSIYTVGEGNGNIDVCIVSSPELDRTVIVDLETEAGTAEGRP